MSTTCLVLPYAVSDKERKKAFTPDMEVAAILFLTKKESVVSKLHYPLWAVPWENESIIIDGLGAFSSTIASPELPDSTAFIDDIERGASIRTQFLTALKKHEKTFKDFSKTVKIPVNALITDEELLSTFVEYVKEARSRGLEENDSAVLALPKFDPQAAVESANKVLQVHKGIQSEIRSLEYARNLLNEAAQHHEQMILKEIESTRETYDAEISRLRPAVEKKVEQVLKERDARIAKMNRIMENELKAKEREKERRERELQRLELARADFSKRRETRKKRHDKIGVTHWEHRIRVSENKIEEVKSRIRALSEFIEKTRRQNEADTEKLRYGYQALVDREKRKIVDIEVQRDSNIETKQKEIENLRLATNQIAVQIDGLVKRKLEQATELKRLAMPMPFDEPTLLCLPFYLACYQAKKKTQFQVFPPVKVMSYEGIVKALKKTIRSLGRASRLNLFLQPRSKALNKMLELFLEEKAKSEKGFNERLLETAASNNIFDRQNFKETLTRGLEELRAEGWISQSGAQDLIKAYT